MRKDSAGKFEAIVIGVSTGGVAALKHVLGALPGNFPVPLLIVAHVAPTADNGLAVLLDAHCAVRVKEADEQEAIEAGTAYLAPANYHLLVERGGRLALSTDPLVNFARPAVDVLFESAAAVYGPQLIGVILTGAGGDGSSGLLCVHDKGGVTIVQNPVDAEMDAMPQSALHILKPDYVEPLNGISSLLTRLASTGRSAGVCLPPGPGKRDLHGEHAH